MGNVLVFIIFIAVVLLFIVPFWVLFKLYDLGHQIQSLEEALRKRQADENTLSAPSNDVLPIADADAVEMKSDIQPAPIPPQEAMPIAEESPAAEAFPATPVQPPEAIPAEASAPIPPPEPTAPRVPSELEQRTSAVLRKIWNWLIIGEEFRNPDVSCEYAVATTWLIRLGILILLFGIGFFLKYSINRNWLQPEVRVTLTILGGLALIGFGLKMQRGNYRLLGSALAGGGFVTLYLSAMAAYALYHLLTPIPTATYMLVVTAAATIFALSINTQLPALIGCVGGYLTMLFVHNTDPSFSVVTLLGFMTILAASVLYATYYRSWIVPQVTALALHCICCVTLFHRTPALNSTQASWTLFFAIVNYLLFSFNVLGTARRRDATILELLLRMVNAAFLFIFAIPIARRCVPSFDIAFVVPIFVAIATMFESTWCKNYISEPRTALQTFLAGETAFALALAVPLICGGIWITTAWSVMAFVFLCIALKTQSRTIFIMSWLLYAVAMVRQFVLQAGFDHAATSCLSMLFQHLPTAWMLIAATAAAAWRIHCEPSLSWLCPKYEDSPRLKTVPMLFAACIAGAIFIFYSSYELRVCMCSYLPPFRNGVLVMWWSLLGYAVLLLMLPFRIQAWLLLSLLLYLASGLMLSFSPLPNIHDGYPNHLLFWMLSRGVFIASLAFGARELHKKSLATPDDGIRQQLRGYFVITANLAALFFFIFTTIEIREILMHYLAGLRNGGITIWWCLIACATLLLGIRHDIRSARIAAFTLFAVCAIKVFAVDIRQIETVWRIAAFAAIGVIMLLGAMLYMRFKTLFTPNKASEHEESH